MFKLAFILSIFTLDFLLGASNTLAESINTELGNKTEEVMKIGRNIMLLVAGVFIIYCITQALWNPDRMRENVMKLIGGGILILIGLGFFQLGIKGMFG